MLCLPTFQRCKSHRNWAPSPGTARVRCPCRVSRAFHVVLVFLRKRPATGKSILKVNDGVVVVRLNADSCPNYSCHSHDPRLDLVRVVICTDLLFFVVCVFRGRSVSLGPVLKVPSHENATLSGNRTSINLSTLSELAVGLVTPRPAQPTAGAPVLASITFANRVAMVAMHYRSAQFVNQARKPDSK